MAADDLLAFEISLHALAGDAAAAGRYRDAWGEWPTLAVPHAALAVPMAVAFDDALERLGRLERMYAEPDGSFVWVSSRAGASWQVDGNACERQGRVLLVDLKGSCPEPCFDRLLAAFGWPGQALMMQLVRAAVFLAEEDFRRHARCRGAARDGNIGPAG